MCGINGILSLKNEPIKEAELLKMNQAMIHRGPDSDGLYFHKNVGLAMRRLAIIDIDGGNQPVFNEDRTVTLIINGEIYNYIELKEKLIKLGHKFKTKSDSEVVAHLYQEYKEGFLTHLNGMFALALYDLKKETLILARDRLGIKPLYFKQTPDRFIFSSNLNSIIQVLKKNPSVSQSSFLKYLGLSYINHPSTIYQDIHKVSPGYYYKFHNEKVEKINYWKIKNKTHRQFNHFNDYKDLVREKLNHAVKLRMRSDVPVGSFLSGGIDSSSIVALMANNNPKGHHTFSVGFEGGENELGLARLVSKKYSTQHFEKLITLDDVIKILPELIDKMDEPQFDSALIPSFILSQEALSQGVKVILNGTGGDEVLGGYNRYLPLGLKEKVLEKTPLLLRKVLSQTLKRVDPRRAHLIQYPAYQFFSHIANIDHSLLKRFYKGSLGPLFQTIREDYSAVVDISTPKKLMELDLGHYLPGNILSLLDKTTMGASIEGRTPFLDHNLVETCFTLPQDILFHKKQLKPVLKESMRPYLPQELFNQKKKGFAGPIHHWMKNGLLKVIQKNFSFRPSFFLKENLNTSLISKIKDNDLNPGVSQLIFALFIFNLWSLRHMEGEELEIN
ncbi:asparagine synthase (glutamine-hydrolyzing) [Bacteriovoracales bacterium]|nr:asparagine synthase (glutamine-hydrolyzing) [Bacteriovoracales bacterium]